MIPIGAEEIVQAVRRVQDFEQVQMPSLETMAEVKERVAAGESAGAVIFEAAQEHSKATAQALRCLKESCGLTSGAQLAFWAEIPLLLEGLETLPSEMGIDQAALVGLIVGLTAQQLAEESGAS
jgi:hypothetical protein